MARGSNAAGQCNIDNSVWNNIVEVGAGRAPHGGFKVPTVRQLPLGSATKTGKCDIGGWKDIASISAGYYHTLGLKNDGTVVASGSNKYGQCDLDDWKNIISVRGGNYHTVGLKKDGTVVAKGNNDKGQCDVSDWTDIVAVSAGKGFTVGVKSDGSTVVSRSK